ncbi:MAG: DmsE family decaheme c-type cytochrome [Pseudomonadota bacterium]
MTPRTSLLHVVAVSVLCWGVALGTAGGEEAPAPTNDEMHGDVHGGTYSEEGPDACLGCHQSPGMSAIFGSVHMATSDARAPGGQHQCESCHGPMGDSLPMHGDAVISFGAEAATPVEEQNEVCLGCHQETAADWSSSAHAADDLGCVSCHTIHSDHDPVLTLTEQPEQCYTCHLKERGQMQRPYVHPVRFGKMNCSTCHDAHGSPTEFALKHDTLNETCYSCHAEKRGPFAFEHAPAAEDCSLCHESHGSSHAGMLTKAAPVLCQQCHSQRDHPSIRFTSEGLEDDSRSSFILASGCMNCHSGVHGSNHPSGITLTR